MKGKKERKCRQLLLIRRLEEWSGIFYEEKDSRDAKLHCCTPSSVWKCFVQLRARMHSQMLMQTTSPLAALTPAFLSLLLGNVEKLLLNQILNVSVGEVTPRRRVLMALINWVNLLIELAQPTYEGKLLQTLSSKMLLKFTCFCPFSLLFLLI